jgi:hypothetical protein
MAPATFRLMRATSYRDAGWYVLVAVCTSRTGRCVIRVNGAGVIVCCNRREIGCVMARITFQGGCKMVDFRNVLAGNCGIIVAAAAIAGNRVMVKGCGYPCNGGVAIITDAIGCMIWRRRCRCCRWFVLVMAGGAGGSEYAVIHIGR